MSDTLTRKDFENDREVRWCPGCGDYAVLASVLKVLPQLEVEPHNHVFVSGIGCSSRFPYYLNTYGFHTIHGRAPTIATGLKLSRPELSVWIVTGDGDGLSIGANHLLHLMRRNIDVTVLLFNNQIYGLTKGQLSPTSVTGQVTKSTPRGSVESPLNPMHLALAANCSHISRAIDIDSKGLQATILAAARHKGTSLVEIYQNCNVFNDGAFDAFAQRATRAEKTVSLIAGEPMIYGAELDKGLAWEGGELLMASADNAGVFEPENQGLAFALANMDTQLGFPVALGALYTQQRPVYEQQITQPTLPSSQALSALLKGEQAWER